MRKVVIIGAGHVGSHCGYALAHSGIASEIVLVDVDKEMVTIKIAKTQLSLLSQSVRQESRDRQDLIC